MNKQPFYRIAPKWKLMLLILVSSLSFRLYDWRFYLINLSSTLALSGLMHISYRQLCKPIGTCFYLLIVSFLMHTFWGEWIDGIKVVLRACNIVLFASWILLTTSYLDIIEGLATLLKPLAYVGIKPAKVSLAVTLAIRFMPVIHNTFKEIKMAQKARGIDKSFITILIPALIKTIKMADDIAAAITARSWE
ncbi:Cobalt transport protein [Cardinium endosymbiont of Sogatella furcifera]|uniref:energy-coupling factor transporter transmembrane component T family protein n=1 Tax=Cardinium endosymbiont of Sogatella furcifera TaxID=650378 RepID=UPI000E0DB528|nr:energy-coupling factor transporter transmembrane protein EcfT [Cardinium endosymbiont of Sogatella furcifera]AXI24320.1 Cobalt transport protein [Cardinium endosymbiont of Sogatella furcifera]